MVRFLAFVAVAVLVVWGPNLIWLRRSTVYVENRGDSTVEGVRVFACEVETAAPLHASLAAGAPRDVTYTPSFVDGIGAPFVLPEMWPLARRLLDASLVMSLGDVAAAIRLLAERNRVIAEGAGGTSVAAALAGKAGSGKIVCVISGGNLDTAKLAAILNGEVP